MKKEYGNVKMWLLTMIVAVLLAGSCFGQALTPRKWSDVRRGSSDSFSTITVLVVKDSAGQHIDERFPVLALLNMPGITYNAGFLQGVPIDTAAPAVGQTLTYNGTDWIPTTPAAGFVDTLAISPTVTLRTISISASKPETIQVGAWLNYTGGSGTASIEVDYTDETNVAVTKELRDDAAVTTFSGIGHFDFHPTIFHCKKGSTAQIKLVGSGGVVANVGIYYILIN